jgi:hypothetical protein
MGQAALERLVIAFVGVCFLTFGGLLLSSTTDRVTDFVPWAWPWVFLAAGIATLWWAEFPLNFTAFRLSGYLGITALTGRAVNLVYVLLFSPDAYSGEYGIRVSLGVLSYLLSAILLSYTWHRLWPRTVRLNDDRGHVC